VSWLGARSDVPDLLNAADVALHASTFPEPFGLVLVEALAFGKPLLARSRARSTSPRVA
jgi:glycosyltransferase involved in cell wall biosynthesis